jgi:hypothetical protein
MYTIYRRCYSVYNIYNDMLCILFTGDAIEFMSWFLNAVHGALNGNRKLSSSIVNKTFRGTMRVYTHKNKKDQMLYIRSWRDVLDTT